MANARDATIQKNHALKLEKLVQKRDQQLSYERESLQLSEHRFALISELAPIGIYQNDVNGNCIFVNPKYCEIAGVSFEEATGDLWRANLHTEDYVRVDRDWRKALETGRSFYSEYRFLSDDGNVTWVIDKAVAQINPHGEVIGFVGTVADITEQKKMERSLKESNRRFSEVLNVADEAIVSVDENHIITFFSESAEELFEFDKEMIIGQPLDMLLPEATRFIHSGYIKKFAKGPDKSRKMNERSQVTGRRKSGKLFPAEISISKVQVSGSLVFTAFIRDITERKLVEDVQQESARRLQEIIDGLYEFVGLIKLDGTFVEVNRSPLKAAGLEAKDIIGLPFWDAYWWSHDRAVQQRLRDAIARAAKGEMVRYQDKARVLNGNLIDVDLSFGPMRAANGDIDGILCFGVNITDRKLAEEQLRQSQKLESLGTLAAGIAHDFNNVLTPILGNAEMLLETTTHKNENRESIESIYENSLRAKNIISQILLFGRQHKTQKTIVDLRPLLAELLNFARSTIPATITFKEEMLVESATVRCDDSQIYQILVNLCVNASHAIGKSGKIKITLDIVELNNFSCIDGHLLVGKYVRITVADDGEGMDTETLAQIFDPFYTTKTVGEGTGLGLSTVFGIVKDHEGGIRVSSEPGSGTTFDVYLPYSEESGQQASDPASKIPGTGTGTEHILFVDDEESITSLGQKFLERYGYRVTVAPNGQAALDAIIENPSQFDLLITDHNMPKLTGDLLARKVMALESGMPVILCSGHNTVVTPDNAESFGICKLIHKPYSFKKLTQSVREVLDAQKYDLQTKLDLFDKY